MASVEFIQKSLNIRSGYIEYEWKYPDEKITREKAMFIAYFEPWQWIIAASSYREEFNELVNVEDFRDSVLSMHFGMTGYPFIIDSKGNVILHPKVYGNKYNATDSEGRFFIKEICSQKAGKIMYSWKNPGEADFRDKLVIFNYLPEYDWIVASAGYLEEFSAPLKTMRNVIIITLFLLLMLVLPVSFMVGSSVTRPLKEIMRRFTSGPESDFSERIPVQSQDEVGQLAQYYNNFMERLQESRAKIEKETNERKKVQDALKNSEEKYRTILESIGEGYFETDLTGRMTFFNESICRIGGYTRDDLLGINNREYATPKSAKRMYRVFSEIYKTGNPAKMMDFEVISKRGSIKVLEVSASLIYDQSGAASGFRGIIRDVTDRNKAEKALRESEERFRTLVENAPFGISIMKPDRTFEYFNRKFTDIFGYTLKDIPDKDTWFEKAYPDEKYRKIVISFWEDISKTDLSKEDIRPTIFKVKCKNSGDKIINFRTVALKDGKQFLTYEDITSTKRLRDQLQHAQKMEAIGTIASGVAHNFRNVLSSISVNNQLVQMRYHDDIDLMAIMEKAGNAVDRGAKLVDSLMQFARKDGTKDFKTLNLAELIQEVFDLTRKSFDKKIDIRINIPGSISVIGDHSGLSQVLMNLCLNARDAMPDGGKLRIEARLKGDMAEISVSDTGHGMDKEVLERCFDPFFTSKEVGKGTGLGLSTSYRIIKEHEGDIQAYSETGKGTVFKIYLPVASESESGGAETKKELILGSGQKVLIVDDDVDILEPIKDILEGLGYRADFASDGTEAIEKYISWRPEAVLMDRNMPEMDGITCAKKIIEKDPRARIILISGYDEKGPDGIDLQTKEMISGYLTKPINIVELSNVLARAFK